MMDKKIENRIEEIITIKDMPSVIRSEDIFDYLLIERKRWVEELTDLLTQQRKEAYAEIIGEIEHFNRVNGILRQEPTTRGCKLLAEGLAAKYKCLTQQSLDKGDEE